MAAVTSCEIQENRPMPFTQRSWVQITASSAKFTWLARHRKRKILGKNVGMFFLHWHICIRNKKRYLSLGALT